MELKANARFLRYALIAAGCIVFWGVPGCGSIPHKTGQTTESTRETALPWQEYGTGEEDKKESAADICLELYREAAEKGQTADTKMLERIVKQFGDCGYPAVDSKNQIDMTEAGQVVRFCEKAEAGEETELTLIEVTYAGGFIKYDLCAAGGRLYVVKSCYEYGSGKMQNTAEGSYPAEYWDYTEDGYFVFAGKCHSEEMYVLTLSRAEEHVMLRVRPLDETCREFNRKYLLPIGYERNNMFLVDWNEEEFGELDFYDMYDIFYPEIMAEPVPYAPDRSLGVGAVYEIPKEEFEAVIMEYFSVDSRTLQSKTVYHPQTAAYEYKPRGFYEVEYPEYPYPEVTEYKENSDGTVTLTVHAVFPHTGDSRVYVHEVTVRPKEDGGVQYVSNRVVPSENNREATWHTPRLEEKEWEELYSQE